MTLNSKPSEPTWEDVEKTMAKQEKENQLLENNYKHLLDNESDGKETKVFLPEAAAAMTLAPEMLFGMETAATGAQGLRNMQNTDNGRRVIGDSPLKVPSTDNLGDVDYRALLEALTPSKLYGELSKSVVENMILPETRKKLSESFAKADAVQRDIEGSPSYGSFMAMPPSPGDGGDGNHNEEEEETTKKDETLEEKKTRENIENRDYNKRILKERTIKDLSKKVANTKNNQAWDEGIKELQKLAEKGNELNRPLDANNTFEYLNNNSKHFRKYWGALRNIINYKKMEALNRLLESGRYTADEIDKLFPYLEKMLEASMDYADQNGAWNH